MNIELLKNITDDEKLRIFNISIKIVEETGVDLVEALKTTINKYLENKSNDEVYSLQGVDSYNLSNDELDIVEKSIREESNIKSIELSNDLNELKADFAPFWDAINGKIIDKNEYFSHYYINMDIDKLKKDELFEKLNELNSLRREHFYARLRYYPKEELLEDKNEEINSYRELVERLINNKNEISNWIETPDITANTLFELDNKNGALFVGTNGALPFDYIYFKANSYAFHNESVDERVYNEIIEKIKEQLNKLEIMSLDDFRKYKYSLMMLSEEEKNKFDDRVNGYLENRVNMNIK